MPYLRKRQNAMTTIRQIISLTSGIVFFIAFLVPYNCFSQDSAKYEKILLVERTILKKEQTKPTQKIFHIGKKVAIRQYSSDTLLRGHIESIMDSSIVIKGKTIDLKDVKQIKVIRGSSIIWTGAAASTFSLSLLLTGYLVANSSENSNTDLGMGFAFIGVVGFFCTVPVLIYGIIDKLTAKHYHMDKDFVIMVKTIKKK
jgi:hypothetical protein